MPVWGAVPEVRRDFLEVLGVPLKKKKKEEGARAESGACSTNTHQHTHQQGCRRCPARGPRHPWIIPALCVRMCASCMMSVWCRLH